jgi:hypothetical protein
MPSSYSFAYAGGYAIVDNDWGGESIVLPIIIISIIIIIWSHAVDNHNT